MPEDQANFSLPVLGLQNIGGEGRFADIDKIDVDSAIIKNYRNVSPGTSRWW